MVFDSLSEMRLLARDALRYRRQILALKTFLASHRATVLMLDDQLDINDHQLESIAHGVVDLDYVRPDFGAERRRVSVVKLRGVRFIGGCCGSTPAHVAAIVAAIDGVGAPMAKA